MSTRTRLLLAGILMGVTVAARALTPADDAAVQAAQAYRAHDEPVQAAPDGTYFCEAEEFQAVPAKAGQPGWQAKPWGENYYCGTFANTFLSRKGFLGAPEQVKKATTATLNVTIAEAGKYLVLARYEAAYRFETQFRIRIAQKGKTVFDQLYGAQNNVKIWAFGQKLQKEVRWSWGADENIVWEGYLGEGKSRYAALQPGPATITLTAGKQPEPAAKRNVDLVMLTRDEAQVHDRVLGNPEKKIAAEGYLPLDGWLTQAGDVWLKVTNAGQAKIHLTASMTEHSSYWVHKRNWKPFALDIDPGQTTDWTDAGGVMDTLNDGQWIIKVNGPCTLQIGVRNAAGEIGEIRRLPLTGDITLIGLANMRYARGVQTVQEGIDELTGALQAIPLQGKTPVLTQIHAGSGIMGALQPIFQFKRGLYPIASLGDEIALPVPDAKAAGEGFIAYLNAQGLTPARVDLAAGDDWTKITYNTTLNEQKPGVYYWSMRYLYHYGIQAQKAITDARRAQNPGLLVGANYSPQGHYEHSYLGETFKWVSCFREGGMTMPWSEDYIWGVPVGTPQMNVISVDLFRAGMRHNPDGKIMMYVMPHDPGNIPDMWKRLWYTAMGHGAKIFNLFEFDPVWAAYTENHVNGPAMYGMVLKTLREYGTFEDIVQSGQVRPAQAGFWFSETGDIWHDNAGTFAAAKRALYMAVLHQQAPLDVVVEQDALDGTLNGYKVLYLADRHVSQAASQQIAAWVNNGGRLVATAGAGMFDEYNRPNVTLRGLLGVEQQELQAPKEAVVEYIKQDLPFAPALRAVQIGRAAVPVYGAVSRFTAAPGYFVQAEFTDHAPAMILRRAGKGEAIYCAFLPGLSYFKPAIPKRPVDRGHAPDSMAHFLPVNFDAGISRLIGGTVPAGVRPVEVSAPLVEASVIESKAGMAITLTNWTNTPVKGLKVTVHIPEALNVPAQAPALSSGAPVLREVVNGKPVYTLDLGVADTLILR